MDTPGLVITIPDAAVAPSAATALAAAHEIALPSGAVASIRHGNGRDLRMAQMASGQPFDALKFEYALVAQVATIDGKKLTVEQIDTLPIGDVLELQAEVNRVNFPPTKAPAPGADQS